MASRLQHVVIFDTDESDRWAHQPQVVKALERIGASNAQLHMPTDRRECLELLQTGLPQEIPTLLLCDMVDHEPHGADLGNVGARVLRAVASHPDLSDHVWRVLWTRHDHPAVIADIAPYAHAYVHFEFDDAGERIGEAISYVTSMPPERDDGTVGAKFKPFAARAAKDDDEYMARWRETLRNEVLHPDKPLKDNDEIAVAGIVRGVDDKETTRTLQAMRRELTPEQCRVTCESVDEFLKRVRGDTTARRRAIVKRTFAKMSQLGVATQLNPRIVDGADRLLRQVASEDALRYVTLLTRAEDAVGRKFIDVYRQRLNELRQPNQRGHNLSIPWQALNAAITAPEVAAALESPALGIGSSTEQRRIETLSYVICTYNDTYASAENSAYAA